ncbi:hypothetical protein M106_4184 [Bacteroides fragilis str. 1009-4-F |nr:hypothetical protein M106_4184 [Bacteroides fragilis str. 1009-4-F \
MTNNTSSYDTGREKQNSHTGGLGDCSCPAGVGIHRQPAGLWEQGAGNG